MKERRKESPLTINDVTSWFIFPSLERAVVNRLNIKTAGTEINIPETGKVSMIFLPHNGWAEPGALFPYIRTAREGQRPSIITKIENSILKPAIGERYVFYIDRNNLNSSEFRRLYHEFENEDTFVITAGEGTRSIEKKGIKDIYTLQKLHDGAVRFAIQSKTQIVVAAVIGAGEISPNFDETVKSKNVPQIWKEFRYILDNKHVMSVRFRHLQRSAEEMEIDSKLRGREQKERINELNEGVARIAVKDILSIDPNYPLGHYNYLK